MMSTLAAEYEQELKIKNDYDAATAAGDEEGQEEARTEIHRLWDSITAKGDTYARIYRDYKDAMDKGNTYIDFHDVNSGGTPKASNPACQGIRNLCI